MLARGAVTVARAARPVCAPVPLLSRPALARPLTGVVRSRAAAASHGVAGRVAAVAAAPRAAVRRFATQFDPKTGSRVVGATEAAAGRSAASRWALAGLAGAGVFGLAGVLSMMETDGLAGGAALEPYVRERLHAVFNAFGGGIVLTGGTAVLAHRLGFVRVMAGMSPMMLFFVSAGAGIGSMLLCLATPKENVALKMGSFALFNACMGASLAPIAMVAGPIVLKAALYTGAIVGSLSLVAANTPSQELLWMGGPLALGLGVVCVASIAPMFLPAASAAMPMLYNVSMYGGLALFSGFVLYDASRIMHHAAILPEEDFDPINQSISIYMDTLNIFIRLVTILSGGGNRRK